MARYRKIDVRIWNDAKFRSLSPAPPNAQTLFIHLLTCPATTNIPGLFSVGEIATAEILGWDLEGFKEGYREAFPKGYREGFREAFLELSQKGLVEASWKDRLVWIPNAIRFNPPESPNVIRSWSKTWDELPECDLKTQAYHRLKAFVEGLGEAFLEAFLEALPKAPAKGMPNQEQEQEQDQDLDLPADKQQIPEQLPPPPKSQKKQTPDPKKTPDPRHAILTKRLTQEFENVRGEKYNHSGGQCAQAIARLLGQHEPDRIYDKWSAGIRRTKFPVINDFSALAKHWNSIPVEDGGMAEFDFTPARETPRT